MRRRTYLATAGTALLATAGCTDLTNRGGPDETTDDPTTDDPTTDGTTPDETTGGTPTTPPPAERLTNPSFESDLEGWTVGSHLPEDPNKTTGVVDSSVETTDQQASDGDHALAISIDGRQDDGTVWVQQAVDLSGVSTLAVDAPVTESFNHITDVAVYTGPVPADSLVEQDFDVSNAFDGHDSEGWKTFEYDVDHDGPGLVAVGVNVVWETEITRLLDNVRLVAPSNDS